MNQFLIPAAMIIAATLSTLLPHPQNFTPMAAIALFSGASFLDQRAAFGFPFAVLLLRDLWLGLHVLMPAVYGAFFLTVLIGFKLREKRNAWRIIAAAASGSVVFFILTNFAVWAQLGTFPRTTMGLAACYTAALPHFKNTLLGDLVYSACIFGIAALAQHRFKRVEATA